MKKNSYVILLIIALSLAHFAMGRNRGAQYDTETPQETALQETDTQDGSTTDQEAKEKAHKAPVQPSKVEESFLGRFLHGFVKVITFGQADVKDYEVVEPEKGTTDTSKIKLKF